MHIFKIDFFQSYATRRYKFIFKGGFSIHFERFSAQSFQGVFSFPCQRYLPFAFLGECVRCPKADSKAMGEVKDFA
ncbi:hypothetical protein BPO_1230 [Bergeyella porcorum]|uniref:Uncharacterized protein n=1 Tax=Bergeyella porcorum TaxID=1735111 RepID=A0AAU0EZM7_9FLAO